MTESGFAGWENFYVMLGSSAAALIGLLVVAVTLTTGLEQSKALRGARLYMTPTATGFGVVLLSSAAALAPRLPPVVTGAVFGVGALVGGANAMQAWLGIRSPPPGLEPPHWSDIWFYGAFPVLSYVALAGLSIALGLRAGWAPWAAAALLMALLFLGIRNAWDLVTWLAPRKKDDS